MNKQQLAARIWASANEMRSKIEASEYKDYILGFIFYKFLSDREEQFLLKNGFDRESMETVREDDPETLSYVQNNLGYFISYDDLYSTWLAKGSDFDVSDVRDALSAFSRLIKPSHKNVFDKIFDTLETGLSKLGDTSGAQTKAISALLQLIRDIPMDGKQGYDVLGYIYEYLISNFAANAGKKAGEFYTPHEVSTLISRIVAQNLAGRGEVTVYDPTSGSGSLLITIGEAIARQQGYRGSIKYYAQELKENTYNLTRMNLVMRGIAPDNIVCRCGDTLEDDWPWFEEGHPESYEPLFVDAVVSNPPYSQRWDPEGKDSDRRFDGYGVAPKSKADYAFLLHDLYHLKPDGVMCIVLPHGVLFRGGEEEKIRTALVENENIDAIIGFPANIFFGTGIPTIVMVLKKHRPSDDVLIIDASKGFVKDGKNNRLRACDIRRIVDAYRSRKSVERFCRVIPKQEIRDNGYNLNIPRYVDSSEAPESWDIYATMFGGIPVGEVDALKNYWDALPGLCDELFESAGGATVCLRSKSVEETVRKSPAVRRYLESYDARFSDFGQWLYDELVDESSLVNLPTEEDGLAREIFDRLGDEPLVDRYDAYQVLDDSWQGIEADLEVIQTEGFDAVKKVDPNMVTKKKNGKEVEVQDGWRGRVLPFDLVQREMLADDLLALDSVSNRMTAIDGELSEIVESLTEDDKAALGEALNDAGDAFVASKLRKAVKELRSDGDEDELADQAEKAWTLLDEQKAAKKEQKSLSARLEANTKCAIEGLSDQQARVLLDAKWNRPIEGGIAALSRAEIDGLVDRVRDLSKKYETTFAEVDEQIRKEESHLSQMLGQLTGNEYDMAGIHELMDLLGGEAR
ncbi:type I restriction-modification system subunit M [Olsenella sp. AF16-14LB]|uniref:type I restriction-modification system subunit M n=1 Tax=unclassified Olsenella TaxID=2638792 RepID=UPI000E552AC4|nr:MULTISPECIES: type I restriction-modification system subunit M [unclassified Olsenella]RGU52207.1 type I restriction-modification system subunit M [Olsenella sp. AF16-14LB]RGU83212.1 type I restriction-modification system subunit M [Olsenella sp. AF15-43LB]